MSSLKYSWGLVLGLLFVSGSLVSCQWQDHPINCYTCTGDDCTNGVHGVQICNGASTSSQACMTVFGADNTVISRGCSDNVVASLESYCETNANNCIKCLSNGCNLATALSEFVECVSCDSRTDTNCVLNPTAVTGTRLCRKSCMVALYARNASDSSPAYELSRSCLDDKEEDDMKICSDGGDDLCKACDGAKCNIAKLPENRFSCHHCNGNDCENSESQECVTYSADDQCYRLFDDWKEVVELGCRSKFDTYEITTQIKDQKILLCDGANCNDYEDFPQPNKCVKCDSTTDENCAIRPALVGSPVSCNIPYSQCYSMVSDVIGGKTIRGCLSELLGDEFYKCLMNGDNNCQSCSGEECNVQIIPADRLQCQRCNSDTDIRCHTNPSTLTICPIYSENDSCVSAFKNGVTTRGCASELTCDPTDLKSCQICSETGCNTNNVKKSTEEIYGIFQDLPLSCLVCNGDSCDGTTEVIEKCEGNNFQDCMTVFGSDGKVLRRGCEDLVEADYITQCNENPELCFKCKSNKCNTIASPTDYVECIYCDSAIDANCVRDVNAVTTKRKCAKGCLTALYSSRSDTNIFELVRTCLDDVEADEVDDCGKDSTCVQCSGSNCNSVALPATRLSCNYCLDGDCEFGVPTVCSAFSETDQCFMFIDETLSVGRMGCRSELSEDEIKKSIKQLFFCDTDNCNNVENFPEANICAVCNSKTDPNCAISPVVVTEAARCQTFPYTQCYSKLTEDGHTARGCLLSLEVDDFLDCLEGDGTNCQTCTGNGCNKEIFPANRQKCHRCSSSNDADCESLPSASQVCHLYVEGDNCVTKVVSGITSRDCGSALNCDSLGRKDCRACSGSDCNTVDLVGESVGDPGLWTGVPLNCHTCEGPSCATSMGNVQSCQSNILQTCTTVFNQENEVISRGCSDVVSQNHAEYCNDNPADCIECKSNGCNSAISRADYIDCIFCDGRTNANCTMKVADVSRTRKCHMNCMTALYPRTSDINTAYDLVRTCLDDKDEDDRLACEAEVDVNCQSCNESGCNTQLMPAVRKSCYQCSGEGCQLPAAGTCNSYTSEDQCFIMFDEVGSILKAGCKSDHDPPEIQMLLAAKRMFLCDGDNCNDFGSIPLARSCRLCNSRTDKFCATDPLSVASSTTCSKVPVTDCYTRMLSDGHIERGCLSSLNGDQFLSCYYESGENCTICAEGLCNDKVFPADRLSCHTCNSAEDPSCVGGPKHAAYCLKHSADQTCITTLNDGITQRGCSDELTCDPNDTSSCRICDTPNCNVINLKRNNDVNPGFWQDLPLNCFICRDDDCTAAPTRVNVCDGNTNQHCMTVFGESGTAIRRGCSEAVEEEYGTYCDENSGLCFNCNSNGCNTATALSDYVECVYCDSRIDNNCVSDVTAVSTTRLCNKACMVALYPRNENETSIFEMSRSCLDDKDLDDRELCGSDGSLCKQCTSAECNVEDAVEDRLQCNHCVGESCESPVSKKCNVYTDADTCFMYFDLNNSVQQMGCTSQLEANELAAMQDKLYKCSGNNCNDYPNIPQTQTCASCDSSSDVRCATSPTDVPSVVKCSSLPNVECYTLVTNAGQTVRGCVSDLTQALRTACLGGDDETCSSCKGDGCNMEIFPSDRLSCNKCNSISDVTCQDNPNAPYVCPIYKSSEVCSSKLVNDVTYRGCGEDFICDDTDKQYCKMCNTTNCNRANLYQNNIGYPGIWQGLPINCMTCLGEECNDPSVTKLRKCEDNNQQNCVTVFDISGKVVQRGCSDLIYEGYYDDHCDNHPELCTYCKSSGCNDAESLDDFVDCLFCDSETDPKCVSTLTDVSKTRKCHKQCMTALYPRSKIDPNPAYELSRSCVDDKDLDEREECITGNEQYCKVCEGSNCNKDLIPAARLSCMRCTGEACETPIPTECPAYRENDRCYILFEENSIDVKQMGCSSDFETSTLTALYKQLLICDGDNCNDYDKMPIAHTCLVCDSAIDPLCASKPTSMVNYSKCNSFPYSSCYTRIEGGLTKRGCLSDNEADLIEECLQSGDDAKCNVCTAEYCNVEIYPPGRRSCHRCTSDDDNKCHSSPSDPSVCPFYDENDECVVEISGDTTNRGCTSEFSCNVENRETCRICTGDNCNSVDLLSNSVGEPGKWQDLPLSCYHCEGEACQTSMGDESSCSGNYLQNCMTVFNAAGEVIKRGCSDDIATTHESYCDENIGNCQSCKSSNCNNVMSMDDYVDCIFCDSASNLDCVLNPSGVLRTRKCNNQCMVALYPRSSEENPSFDLERSCWDDKDLAERNACAAGSDQNCKTCTGASCNVYDIPTNRHQCWTCRGEDCENAKVQDCVSYHPEDQCYILFDNVNEIAAMGCRSEFEHDTVTGLIQQQNLLLCDENNCNSYESIPNPQGCIVCNSAVDPRCATNPNLISNVTTCSSLPYTGCFTHINADGDTVRGCQSDLSSTEFYGCYTATDPACSICTGNNCNADVFPADRLKCHRCDSATNANCAESPASNIVCPKITDEESCVVAYKDGVTFRGCSSELSCNVADKSSCRICSGSACNTHNLEVINKDGKPGMWQDIPLNCYSCVGDTCKSDLGSVQMCSNNNLQNCMTVFNADGDVIQRGCSDTVLEAQETWCDANTDNCLRCNSNGCNKAFSLDEYIDCVSCDTNSDGSCVKDLTSVTKTRKCYQSCMIALYPRTTEEDPAYGTTRTCLDDKDLDDRLSCQAGSEDLCKACNTDKCNIDDMPADRRSCYQCSGDGCQLPKAELCPGYRANDQCFFNFDEMQTVTDMGCKSDLTIAQSDELIKAKRLLLCDGDDCNDLNNLPLGQACALCNSRTDVNCAVNPQNVTSTTTCGILPYTQCYSRVLSDGATERGCLSNLVGNDFYDCLNGNSTTCQACLGASCNKQVYPADRISCHVCDSSTDPTCEGAPNSLNICPKYVENETCATSFVFGTTQRDCGTELTCDPSNRRNCRVCSSTGCNTVDLASKFDDNFGKWQDLPLSCYHCEGESCQLELDAADICENNNEQDCLTVFSAEGQVIRRGCSDVVEPEYEEYCDTNSGLCFNCKSNECNTATALSEYTECISCDSNSDKTCVTNPLSSTFKTRQCQGGCMVALYPSDSSANPAYDLIRTCLNDKESADQTLCTTDTCKSCTGAKCNIDDLPEDRMSCYTCFGDNCEIPVPGLCPLYKENDQCFIRFDTTNTIAEMGCLSEFRGQEISDVLKTKRVFICEGENCNVLEKIPASQQCSACDSASNINCATNAVNIGTVSTCNQLPYTDCYTKITTAGTTERGCLAELEENEFVECILSGGDKCSHCTGDGCNREVFPENRLQCFYCDSETDPNCETWPTTTTVCPYVLDSEKCVSVLEGNHTERACSSHILCDANDKSSCRHCSLTECNTHDLMNPNDDGIHGMWQDLPLRCHSCIGDYCAHSLGPALNCSGGDQQDCLTVFNEDGEVVRRGCKFDVEDTHDLYCRQNPEKCLACKSNECNDAWDLNDFVDCVFCNSETDPSCASNPSQLGFPTRKCQKGCMAATYTSTNVTQVIRTCLDDKEIQVQYRCSLDESAKECMSCLSNNCNNFNYPTDRLTCHVCQGPDCSTTIAEHCAIYAEDDTCFAKYENGKVEQSGCSSSVESSLIESWKQQGLLFTCDNDNCNSPTNLPTPQTCVVCDSSKDVLCATNPSAVTGSELCAGPITSCFTNVTNGVTHRGCMQSLSVSQQTICEQFQTATLCESCSGEKCNSQVYPADRRSCHICNSESDDKCRTEPEVVSICPTYIEHDNCVSRLTDELLERGCESDIQCDTSDEGRCKYCDTDACNFEELSGGAHTIIANNILLTLLVAVISVIGVNSKWF